MSFAHVCERKDATDKWIIEKIIEEIDRLTHTEVILKRCWRTLATRGLARC